MGAAVTAPILWWVLSALSVAFVVADWRQAPLDFTMHAGFVLVTAFLGPLGLVLYLLTAREPLPGTHRRYIGARWKQAVGSTLHCVAGDSVGIVGAAVLTRLVRVPMVWELLIEYAAGFLVGWLVFQSLFMKDMAGGSYRRAVAQMLFPEWLSMNGVMAGMGTVMVLGMRGPAGASPGRPAFWFLMSVALAAGAVVAYPLNWWLVAHQLKHGLMSTAPAPAEDSHAHAHDAHPPRVAPGARLAASGASVLLLLVAFALAAGA